MKSKKLKKEENEAEEKDKEQAEAETEAEEPKELPFFPIETSFFANPRNLLKLLKKLTILVTSLLHKRLLSQKLTMFLKI